MQRNCYVFPSKLWDCWDVMGQNYHAWSLQMCERMVKTSEENDVSEQKIFAHWRRGDRPPHLSRNSCLEARKLMYVTTEEARYFYRYRYFYWVEKAEVLFSFLVTLIF